MVAGGSPGGVGALAGMDRHAFLPFYRWGVSFDILGVLRVRVSRLEATQASCGSYLELRTGSPLG